MGDFPIFGFCFRDLPIRVKAFFICYEYEEITPILKGTWRYKQANFGTFEAVPELTRAEVVKSLIETQN